MPYPIIPGPNVSDIGVHQDIQGDPSDAVRYPSKEYYEIINPRSTQYLPKAKISSVDNHAELKPLQGKRVGTDMMMDLSVLSSGTLMFMDIEWNRGSFLINMIAWIIVTEDGDLTINHHIVTDSNRQEVCNMFTKDFRNADVIISHNLPVDLSALKHNNNQWLKASDYDSKSFLCTMYSTTKMIGLRKCNGALKPPRLEELYTFLYGHSIPPTYQLHHAKDDCMILYMCVTKLMEIFNEKVI